MDQHRPAGAYPAAETVDVRSGGCVAVRAVDVEHIDLTVDH